jgi:hypothetical protein
MRKEFNIDNRWFSLKLTYSSTKLENKLTKLFDYIDNDEFEKAKSLLSELREKYGDTIPELTKAQALIDLWDI